ncbi:hypothetical protein QYE76_011090 [Lolium multiflorum]|uniref:Uncharacterized protein n=1 Tax=Lolium multiflorum TaxID=4521 RepID=A0AAD8TYH7_LOLMU|nr:hypothetical protein QYE76_011090 [Lolium multiflorum]
MANARHLLFILMAKGKTNTCARCFPPIKSRLITQGRCLAAQSPPRGKARRDKNTHWIGMSSSDEVACGKKTSWPELVGKSIDQEAKKTILSDRPDVKTVEVFPVGTGVTKDLRLDRVRIFVDTVAEIPRIG